MIRQKDLACRLRLPTAFVTAIGHVITQWAHFEDQIDQEILELGKLTACRQFNTKRLIRCSVQRRLEIWREMSLAAYSDPRDQHDVEEVYRLADETRPDRDAAAHAMWGSHKRSMIEFRSKRGEAAEIKNRADAVGDMERCAKKISNLNALHISLRARVADILAFPAIQ
jgi:hypothetical protein